MRVNRVVRVLGALGLIAGLTACGADTVQVAAPKTPATESPTPTSTMSGSQTPPSPSTPSKTAKSTPTATPTTVTVPTDAPPSRLVFTPPDGYELTGARLTDGGGLVRTWRMPAGIDTYCVIVAGQQPGYTGDFPAAAIAAFRVGREDGEDIQADSAIPPIAGTGSGVAQAMSYVFSRGADGNAPGELQARQYLTTDHTLVSINATGPAEYAENCQLNAIVSSLKVTTR